MAAKRATNSTTSPRVCRGLFPLVPVSACRARLAPAGSVPRAATLTSQTAPSARNASSIRALRRRHRRRHHQSHHLRHHCRHHPAPHHHRHPLHPPRPPLQTSASPARRATSVPLVAMSGSLTAHLATSVSRRTATSCSDGAHTSSIQAMANKAQVAQQKHMVKEHSWRRSPCRG